MSRPRSDRPPADDSVPGQPAARKLVDGFAKQLVSIAPAFWVDFATKRSDLRPGTPLDPEFRLVFRQADTLLPVTDAAGNEILILFEFQYTYDPHMPRRLNAYAALAEERYRRPVFPVLVNFQPLPAGVTAATVYESACFGLGVRREFHTINLWAVPATTAFEPEAAALLVLVPFLDGGDSVPLMERALTELRQRIQQPDLELFLLYLVQKVGGDEALRRLGARLDMSMLRQTNVFEDLIEEGRAEGRAEGRVEGLRLSLTVILEQRFGAAPTDIVAALDACDADQLAALMPVALTADSLAAFQTHLPAGRH